MVAVARGSMLPHINMSIQRDFYSQEDLFGDDARSWTLGVYATWDIFKGMQNIGEVKKAKAQKRAAEYMVQFETRQARVQATEALLKAQAAHEKVLVARGADRLAALHAEAAYHRVAAGGDAFKFDQNTKCVDLTDLAGDLPLDVTQTTQIFGECKWPTTNGISAKTGSSKAGLAPAF